MQEASYLSLPPLVLRFCNDSLVVTGTPVPPLPASKQNKVRLGRKVCERLSRFMAGPITYSPSRRLRLAVLLLPYLALIFRPRTRQEGGERSATTSSRRSKAFGRRLTAPLSCPSTRCGMRPSPLPSCPLPLFTPEYQRILSLSADARLARALLDTLSDAEDRVSSRSMSAPGASRWLVAASWMEQPCRRVPLGVRIASRTSVPHGSVA